MRKVLVSAVLCVLSLYNCFSQPGRFGIGDKAEDILGLAQYSFGKFASVKAERYNGRIVYVLIFQRNVNGIYWGLYEESNQWTYFMMENGICTHILKQYDRFSVEQVTAGYNNLADRGERKKIGKYYLEKNYEFYAEIYLDRSDGRATVKISKIDLNKFSTEMRTLILNKREEYANKIQAIQEEEKKDEAQERLELQKMVEPPVILKATTEFTPPVVVRDEDEKNETSPVTVQEVKEQIFQHVDQMPQFPGGDTELMKWLKDCISYPTIASEQGIQGSVTLRFVVRPDGSIEDVQVVKPLEPSCDKEAVRVIRKMPKWIPGKQNGNPVSVYYNLPVVFRLQKENQK